MRLLIISLLLTFFASCDSNSNSPSNSSYENTKMSLEDKEKANPLSFLSAKGTYRKNLINQWVFEGTIANTATLATYKDVVLRIVYYSKTNSEVGSEDKTVFEYFKPGTNQEFKIKSRGYEGAETVGFEIVSAAAL